MTDWDLRPRSEACNSCQKAFVAEQPYYSILTFTAQGYCRQDLCTSCWPVADRTAVLSHWQGVYQPPPQQPTETVKKETAESLLRKVMSSEDTTVNPVRYILAVMLERKRLLKPRQITHRGDQRVLVYEHAKTGESFVIPDPNLRLDRLEDVQKEIVTLLGAPDSAVVPTERAAAPSASP